MKFIIGKKLNMTQTWRGDEVVSVTKVKAGPCIIVQVKTGEKDGYQALQIGFGNKKKKNIRKPQKGHLEKLKSKNSKLETNLRYLREFRFNNSGDSRKTEVKIGDIIDVSTFKPGDKVKATGVSKGRGFQGVVKRHGFKGQSKTHGTKDQVRMPGSIGATGPAHVFKGVRMPGRMGGDRVTVKNLEIIEVDEKNDILLIKGAIPGARNGLILIQGDGELKLKAESEKVESEKEKDKEACKIENKGQEDQRLNIKGKDENKKEKK